MKIESLGNGIKSVGRYARSPFPRNPWDMHLHAGRIYIGAGDSAANAGPVPIFCLDPATGEFIHEYLIQEEQIDSFHTLLGLLVIPGHDPRGKGVKVGFYHTEAIRGDWTRSVIGKGMHCFSLTVLGNRLYAALGGGPVMASAVSDGNWIFNTAVISARHYTNFTFQDRVFSFGVIPYDYQKEKRTFEKFHPPYNRLNWSSVEAGPTPLDRYAGVLSGVNGWYADHRLDLDVQTLFPAYTKSNPEFTKNTVHKLVRPVVFGDKVLYIGGTHDGDLGTEPHSASCAHSLIAGELEITGIDLGYLKPRDFVVREGVAYLLASYKLQSEHAVYILESRDGEVWREIFSDRMPTFARSFEEYKGDFYLGLGCDADAPSPQSGDIIRVTP